METTSDDGMLAGLCCGAALNLLLFTPVGGLVGHYWKGRWRDGAGLGFLLGPIGWLLIPLLNDTRRKCPACYKSIDPRAYVCPYCQSDLEMARRNYAIAATTPGTAKRPVRAVTAGGNIACPDCKVEAMRSVELGDIVLTCPQCGKRLKT